jgi:hypothetical protein
MLCCKEHCSTPIRAATRLAASCTGPLGQNRGTTRPRSSRRFGQGTSGLSWWTASAPSAVRLLDCWWSVATLFSVDC